MKWFDSVQGRVHLIFLAFALLVMLSVGATFWGIQTQKADARIINLAGRQRMLTQKITWLALAQPDNPELAQSVQLFENTLNALRYGGAVQVGVSGAVNGTAGIPLASLPPVQDDELQAYLEQAARLWEDFRHHLDPLDTVALQAASPALLSHLDQIVTLFELRAEAKLQRVQVIQLVSFLAALALLVWGYRLTRLRVFTPLKKLGAFARRMAAGEMDLPLPIMRQDELGELGAAFEKMRIEVSAAQNQLEARVARRTRELAEAFELSQEIVAQLDLEHLLRSVTERASMLTGAKSAAICLLEKDHSTLILSASSMQGEKWLDLRQPLHPDLSECVVSGGRTMTTPAECAVCAFLSSQAPGESAVAPLRLGEVSLGALCVVREPGVPFDADETRALTLLCNAAALAIENARLVDAGRKQAEQAAVLAERERLSAELHDNLAQTLSYLNMQIDLVKPIHSIAQDQQSLEKLERMQSAVSGAYEQVRLALVGLNELTHDGGDFAHQMEKCLDDFRQKSGVPAELEILEQAALELPKAAQTQALNILREALANIRKHAHASHVHVRLDCKDGESWLSIEDDGCGFDPDEMQSSHHLGLRLMQARAERSGAWLEVQSTPGAGTRVVVGFRKKMVRA